MTWVVVIWCVSLACLCSACKAYHIARCRTQGKPYPLHRAFATPHCTSWLSSAVYLFDYTEEVCTPCCLTRVGSLLPCMDKADHALACLSSPGPRNHFWRHQQRPCGIREACLMELCHHSRATAKAGTVVWKMFFMTLKVPPMTILHINI